MAPAPDSIRRVDVYAVPYTNAGGPIVLSGGRVSTGQDSTVVRLETGRGVVGWGEASVITPSYVPGYGPAVRAAIEPLARALLGACPLQVERNHDRMAAAVSGHAYARSALDMAGWDLLGRITGLRLADALGGARQEELPLYAVVGVGDPVEMRARCLALLAEGYRHVQVKAGSTARADVARIVACCEVMEKATVVVDANAFWTPVDAARVAAAVDDLDLVLEQPCASLEACASVRRRSRRPLVLDESIAAVADIVRAHAAEACDAVRLKLIRLGGVTPARRARDLAVELGLSVAIEDAGGGDIVSAACAHLSASVPPAHLLSAHLPGAATLERIAAGTPVAVEGIARLPSGPGLGIEVDVAALGRPVLRIE